MLVDLSIFKTKTFKDLKATWYKTLRTEGFKDVECPNEDRLLLWDSHQFSRLRTKFSIGPKTAYYYYAEHFLNSHVFASNLESNIWALHSEGTAIRKIAQALRQDPNTVYKTVIKLKDLMMSEIEDE